MRAVIYLRLSRDTGSSSLARQRASCEAFCASHDWLVTGYYTDNDISAYRPRAPRVEFERLLEDVACGAIDVVVVFKIDRLVRRPADFERFWDEAESRGTDLASVTEPIDSSTPHGVAFIRILVALAGLESATTGLRIAALRREEAAAGRAGPGKAYGLSPDWTSIVESEAAVIREAASRVLGGERIAAITRDWRARGVHGPRGKPWTNGSLNRILHNSRIAGDRSYRGAVVATACFPAILDHDTFDRLQVELGQPQRRGSPGRHAPRLATGTIVCGRCGAKLMQTTRSGKRFYSCPHIPTGCGRLHVNAGYADAWLCEAVCRRLRNPMGDATPAAEDIRQRLAELSKDYYARRLITRDEFLAARATLESDPPPSRDIGRVAQSVAEASDPVSAMTALGMETQRDLFRRYITRVTVQPAARRGMFNPDRLEITWRDSDLEDASLSSRCR